MTLLQIYTDSATEKILQIGQHLFTEVTDKSIVGCFF